MIRILDLSSSAAGGCRLHMNLGTVEPSDGIPVFRRDTNTACCSYGSIGWSIAGALSAAGGTPAGQPPRTAALRLPKLACFSTKKNGPEEVPSGPSAANLGSDSAAILGWEATQACWVRADKVPRLSNRCWRHRRMPSELFRVCSFISNLLDESRFELRSWDSRTARAFAGEGCQEPCAISIELTEAIPAPNFEGVNQDHENATAETRATFGNLYFVLLVREGPAPPCR